MKPRFYIGRLALGLLLVAAASGFTVWLAVVGHYSYLTLSLPVLLAGIWLVTEVYRSHVRKITFMFDAIENDDYLFNFAEDAHQVNEAMLNMALNRIREILVKPSSRPWRARSTSRRS